MKTLIYQVYVGQPSALYDHCTQSVKAYAERIGADYHCQTQPILRIKPNPFTSNRSKEAVERLGYLPIYEKENAFDYLDRYDRIAIIDSDVFVRESAPTIFDQLGDGAAIGAVVEQEMPITEAYTGKIRNYSVMQYHELASRVPRAQGMPFVSTPQYGYEFMNMGVMLIDKSIVPHFKGLNARDWISQPMFQDFVDGKGNWKWSTDQTLLNSWIRCAKVPFTKMNWKWNGLYSANTKIKECHFVHFFLKDKLPAKGENVEALMRTI